MAIEKEVIAGGKVVMRAEDLTFYFHENKPVYTEANFVVRQGIKLTLMGQNGAGKSTLFKIIMNQLAAPRFGMSVGCRCAGRLQGIRQRRDQALWRHDAAGENTAGVVTPAPSFALKGARL